VGGATIVAVEGRPSDAQLLQSIRRAGVRRIDLLVEESGRGQRTAALLRYRWSVGAVVERPERGVLRVDLGPQPIAVPADGPVEVGLRPP
jgi:hypothetical protein